MMTYRIIENEELSVEEYNHMRTLAGWEPICERRAITDLSHTFYQVTVRDEKTLIGLVRVLGNGGYYFSVVDVIVHPNYRRQGIARTMMGRVIERMGKEVSGEDFLFLTLMAAPGVEKLYRQYGFEQRPNESGGCGMTRWIRANSCLSG